MPRLPLKTIAQPELFGPVETERFFENEGKEIMIIRLYRDPETGLPHIYGHNVNEDEVRDVLSSAIEDRAGHDGSRVALGKTSAGRFLRIIYVPDREPDSLFVITAYDLGGKALQALRRRLRKKHGRR